MTSMSDGISSMGVKSRRAKNNDMQFLEMMDSILPFGDRTGNLLIGRTPDSYRQVINISPGTRQGLEVAPAAGSRAAPVDTARCLVYLFTKIGKNNRTVPVRVPAGYPGGPIMRPAGPFTCCLRAAGLTKTPGELGAASSTHRRPYGLGKLSQRP